MPQLPDKWIARIFHLLDDHFEGWSEYVGNDELELKHLWAKELAGLSGDDIKRGLKSAYTHKDPPDITTFKNLCRVSQSAFREKKEMRELPKGDESKQQGEMRSINEILGI